MEPRTGSGSFVGRADELRLLESALGAAAAGHGSTVLVAGEAGIGKTCLAAEPAEQARRGAAVVLSGRCIDLVGAGLPYLPLVEALRPLRGSSALADVPGGLRELSRLIPALTAQDAPAPADGGGPDSQLRLFEETLAVLECLSAATALVLVLEDLYWADGSSGRSSPRAAPSRRRCQRARRTASPPGSAPGRCCTRWSCSPSARLDLVGPRPKDSRPVAGAGLGRTAREEEVLDLLARGYTNREIARDLTISVKTASVHVTYILDKLGVPSRIEAAALAQRLDPLTGRDERGDPMRERGD